MEHTTPVRSTPRKKFGTWLETQACLLDLLKECPTFQRCIDQAAIDATEAPGASFSVAYEDALSALLEQPRNTSAISRQWVKAGRKAGRKNLAGITFSDVPEIRAPLDLTVTMKFTNRSPVTLPCNVKTISANGRRVVGTHGMGMAAFVRTCVDPGYNPLASAQSTGGAAASILDWFADAKPLVTGRDYFALSVMASPELGVVEWHWAGYLSSLTARGRPVVSRSSSRGNVNFSHARCEVLPRGIDISAVLRRAMLPRLGADEAKLAVLGMLAETHTDEELVEAAKQLRDLSPADLLRRLRNA